MMGDRFVERPRNAQVSVSLLSSATTGTIVGIVRLSVLHFASLKCSRVPIAPQHPPIPCTGKVNVLVLLFSLDSSRASNKKEKERREVSGKNNETKRTSREREDED